MTTSSKRPFLLSILLLFVFPVIFLLVFMRLPKDAPKLDTQHVLPIYGPRTPFENENSKGRKFTDTAYFHIPDFKFVN